MNINIIKLAIVLWLIVFNANAFALALTKINISVVDEARQKLPDVKLSIRFSNGKIPTSEITDDQGNCSVVNNSNDGVVVGTAIKEGYYNSTFHHDFYVVKFGMWQPWGKEFKVVMRPIINPVPMYVRNNFFKFPALDREIGFDLEKADWVIPYGQGTRSDFVFKVERRFDNLDNFDAKMTLTFSNPHDGIQVIKDDGGGDYNVGSWFRLPRIAPETGYHPTEQKHTLRGTYGRHDDNFDDNNYFFRVRSEVDKDGNLKRAMYGKIRGDIRFGPGSMVIGMHYYLNPDYTRNLEFDPKRNLFVITDLGENVTAP